MTIGGVSIPKEFQKDERYVLLARIKNLIKKIDDTFVDKYKSAVESKEDAVTLLETELADYVDYEAAYVKAQAQYSVDVLTAKQDYDTSLAKSRQAQADHDTAVKKAEDALETAKEALEEAEEDLQDFEDAVGDGTLRTRGAGEILMVNVEAGKELTDDTVLLAFADREIMKVSVSVGQEDIAGLTIGEKAMVQIEEAGRFEGVITEINPVSNSGGRTNITYSVSVVLSGDVSGLSANQTATVIFGEMPAGPGGEGNSLHNSDNPGRDASSLHNKNNSDGSNQNDESGGNAGDLHNSTTPGKEAAE